MKKFNNIRIISTLALSSLRFFFHLSTTISRPQHFEEATAKCLLSSALNSFGTRVPQIIIILFYRTTLRRIGVNCGAAQHPSRAPKER